MIDLACEVIRISNKCFYFEIFDQQGNLNLTSLVVILYHLVSYLFLGLIPYHLSIDFIPQSPDFE